MQLKCACVYDKESRKQIIPSLMKQSLVLCAMSLVLLILCTVIRNGTEELWMYRLFDFLQTVMIATLCISAFLMLVALMSRKAQHNIPDMQFSFVFDDQFMFVMCEYPGFTGQERIDYAVLFRVVEKENYILLYQNASAMYPARKDAFTEGTWQELMSFLHTVPNLRIDRYKAKKSRKNG